MYLCVILLCVDKSTKTSQPAVKSNTLCNGGLFDHAIDCWSCQFLDCSIRGD